MEYTHCNSGVTNLDFLPPPQAKVQYTRLSPEAIEMLASVTAALKAKYGPHVTKHGVHSQALIKALKEISQSESLDIQREPVAA